jgi:hypothetical protein
MLNPNHPDDERLSALASRDDDAAADPELTAHVSTCDQCADLVAELALLRASLAELPDLAPSRPLRLLPPAEEARPGAADRLGGWARRLFAPALTVGAALAMVGLIGTAAPALDGMASSGAGDAQDQADAQLGAEEAEGSDGSMRILSSSDAPAAAEEHATDMLEADEGAAGEDAPGGDASAAARAPDLPVERSPWPMVLFSGVALVIGALLLRWILVPRAG